MRAKLAQPSQMFGIWEHPNAYYEARRFERDGIVQHGWWQLNVNGRWYSLHVDDLQFERVANV